MFILFDLGLTMVALESPCELIMGSDVMNDRLQSVGHDDAS
jgi:hypothetical protein